MKKLFSLFSTAVFFSLTASFLTGCKEDNNQNQATNKDPIVVYSARAEHLIKPLFDAYTKETGIQVQFHTGNANAFIERLKNEGQNTPADIFMATDAGNLAYATEQGLFAQTYSPIIEKNIPAHLRDPEHNWTGLTVRARAIIYNSDKISASELSTYQDLADPKWKGRLCLTTSGSVYNKSLIAAMLTHDGEEKTKQTIEGWLNNLASKPKARDMFVIDALYANQCDLGVTNSYYYGKFQERMPNTSLKIFWPNQQTTGTHINVSGAGIVKHSKQKEKALALLEWLTEQKAQAMYGASNKEFPASLNVGLDKHVESWGPFKQDTLNLSKVGKLHTKATQIIDQVGFD